MEQKNLVAKNNSPKVQRMFIRVTGLYKLSGLMNSQVYKSNVTRRDARISMAIKI